MTTLTLFGVAILPAIVGLTQVAKDTGLPSRFAPLIAVVFGVLAALAQTLASTHPWIPNAAAGIALGLAACGLYDTAKNVIPSLLPATTLPGKPKA
jgi:hypothetical protein